MPNRWGPCYMVAKGRERKRYYEGNPQRMAYLIQNSGTRWDKPCTSVVLRDAEGIV